MLFVFRFSLCLQRGFNPYRRITEAVRGPTDHRGRTGTDGSSRKSSLQFRDKNATHQFGSWVYAWTTYTTVYCSISGPWSMRFISAFSSWWCSRGWIEIYFSLVTLSYPPNIVTVWVLSFLHYLCFKSVVCCPFMGLWCSG